MPNLPKHMVLETLNKGHLQWQMGLNALSTLRTRMVEAPETHEISVEEPIRLMEAVVSLAKEVDRDLARSIKLIKSSRAVSNSRMAGAFKSLWEFIRKPLRLYGAWSFVKGFKLYVNLSIQSIKMYGDTLQRNAELVASSGHDPNGDVQDILLSARKKTQKITRTLRRVYKSLDAIKIE